MAVQGKKPSKLPWWCWAILLLIFVGMAGAKGGNDPEITPVPPSVPTDVGTLKP